MAHLAPELPATHKEVSSSLKQQRLTIVYELARVQAQKVASELSASVSVLWFVRAAARNQSDDCSKIYGFSSQSCTSWRTPLNETWRQKPRETFEEKIKSFFKEEVKAHHPEVVDALCGLVDSGRLQDIME